LKKIEFQLHLVKIMIRRFGRETLSTYCQTLNGCGIVPEVNNNRDDVLRMRFPLCGPLLVSRMGDAG